MLSQIEQIKQIFKQRNFFNRRKFLKVKAAKKEVNFHTDHSNIQIRYWKEYSEQPGGKFKFGLNRRYKKNTGV